MKTLLTIILTLVLLGTAPLSQALPFNIVPNGTLPTTVILGQSVAAEYIVTNNTGTTRVDNYVKYLPPNVSQTLTGPNACGKTFTLAAKGQPNDHCILYLNVTGAVDADDPNPHHHLFVCFPGGTTCAGTDYPLDVTAVSTIATIAYVTNGGANTVSVCQIGSDGSFTINGCTTSTGDDSSGSGTFFEPAGITLNTTGTIAYVTNASTSTGGNGRTVSVCQIGSDGGFTINGCTTSTGDDSSGSGTFFEPFGVTLNTTGTIAYVTNAGTTTGGANTVSVCQIGSDGSFTTNGCTTSTGDDSSGNGTFFVPVGITLNTTGTIAYVTNAGTSTGGGNGRTVSVCQISSDGSFTTNGCTTSTGDDSSGSGTFFEPVGITLNTTGTIAYVTNAGISSGGGNGRTVSVCQIGSDGSFTINGCTTSTGDDSSGSGTFFEPFGITLNTTGTIAYVTNAGSSTGAGNGRTVSVCQIGSDGSFTTNGCTTSTGDNSSGNGTFFVPAGITLNTTGTTTVSVPMR